MFKDACGMKGDMGYQLAGIIIVVIIIHICGDYCNCCGSRAAISIQLSRYRKNLEIGSFMNGPLNPLTNTCSQSAKLQI